MEQRETLGWEKGSRKAILGMGQKFYSKLCSSQSEEGTTIKYITHRLKIKANLLGMPYRAKRVGGAYVQRR